MNFSTWVNWTSLEGTIHTLIAAFVGAAVGAVEQWFEDGNAFPSTTAQWHHFFGTALAAGASAALLLWKQPPTTAGSAVATVEAAVPAAAQIKAIEPLADSIASAAGQILGKPGAPPPSK